VGGLKEPWHLVPLALAALFIAGSGYALLDWYHHGGDLVVETYAVDLYPDGTLTERFVYGVEGRYRMLYRVWGAPLTVNASLDRPYVRVETVEGAPIPYVRDYAGTVHAPAERPFISQMAFFNEVGCYAPGYFTEGRHALNVTYTLVPPLQYDGEHVHLNLKLADTHVPYRAVSVTVHDEDDALVAVYPHPPTMSVRERDDAVVVSGESPKDALLEIEVVCRNLRDSWTEAGNGTVAGPESCPRNPGAQPFAAFVADTYEKTRDENRRYEVLYDVATGGAWLFAALAFGFPGILAALYLAVGRERRSTVPSYLSFVPKKRKPWQVNLIFNKRATDFDRDGLYATLLDLHRRNIIDLRALDNDILVRIRKEDASMDAYERRVLRFIQRYADDEGVFSTGNVRTLIRKNRRRTHELALIKRDMDALTRVSDAREFIVSGRATLGFGLVVAVVTFLVTVAAFSLWGTSYPVLLDAVVFSLLFCAQWGVALVAPASLFGRWKKDYYRERKEWASFRRFLLDMARLGKYETQDIVIWQEWLVYATALGAGRRVARQLQKMNIAVPGADVIPVVYLSFARTTRAMSAAHAASGGGGAGGGGFGAGGGFGGGGAGGR
jgi:uncharacterized membrane protein